MPTYEYACSACGNAWEEMQKITEAPLTECPKCHQATAKRQISGGNFILKGGGWYADLYSSSSGGSKKSDSSSGSSGSSSSSTTSETKKTETSSSSAAPATPSTTSKSAAE